MVLTSLVPSDVLYIATKLPELDWIRMSRCNVAKENKKVIATLERQPVTDVLQKSSTSPVNNTITRTIKTAYDGSDRYTIIDNNGKKIRTTILSAKNGNKKIYKQTLGDNGKVGKFVKEAAYKGDIKLFEKTYHPNGKPAKYKSYFNQKVDGKRVPELHVEYNTEGHVSFYRRNKMHSSGVPIVFQEAAYEKVPGTNLMTETSTHFDFLTNQPKTCQVSTFEPGKNPDDPFSGITMKSFVEFDAETGKKLTSKEYTPLYGRQVRVETKSYNPDGSVKNTGNAIEEMAPAGMRISVI